MFTPQDFLTQGVQLNNLAVAAFHQAEYDEADSLLKQAMAIWEQGFGPEDVHIAAALSNLSALYRHQGHYAESERLLQRAFRILDRKPGGLSEDVLTIVVPYDLNPETISATMQKLGPWYHNIEVRPGLTTNPPGGDHPGYRWRILEKFLPQDLTGKTVLDIGCNAGYFSFELKKRGASRVVGIDIMPHVLAQARRLPKSHRQKFVSFYAAMRRSSNKVNMSWRMVS